MKSRECRARRGGRGGTSGRPGAFLHDVPRLPVSISSPFPGNDCHLDGKKLAAELRPRQPVREPRLHVAGKCVLQELLLAEVLLHAAPVTATLKGSAGAEAASSAGGATDSRQLDGRARLLAVCPAGSRDAESGSVSVEAAEFGAAESGAASSGSAAGAIWPSLTASRAILRRMLAISRSRFRTPASMV